MYTRKPREKTGLEEAIDQLLSELKGYTADQKEYATIVDQLQKLHALKETEKPDRPSWDKLALVAGNLLGIALIIGHERDNVITTKAVNFILKAI